MYHFAEIDIDQTLSPNLETLNENLLKFALNILRAIADRSADLAGDARIKLVRG